MLLFSTAANGVVIVAGSQMLIPALIFFIIGIIDN
jgi:hypothetical protein